MLLAKKGIHNTIGSSTADVLAAAETVRLDKIDEKARAKWRKRAFFESDRLARKNDGKIRAYREESGRTAQSLRGLKARYSPSDAFIETLKDSYLPPTAIEG